MNPEPAQRNPGFWARRCFLAVVVAGLLWVIKVPVPAELVVGAPKAWARLATST